MPEEKKEIEAKKVAVEPEVKAVEPVLATENSFEDIEDDEADVAKKRRMI
jgi:hypothetical protein